MPKTLNEQEKKYLIPKANIREEENTVFVEIELPGAVKDTISVRIEGDRLIVFGQRESESKKLRALHRESLPFDYRREFILGEDIDTEKITARFEGGVLYLTLMKVEEKKPQIIEVQ